MTRTHLPSVANMRSATSPADILAFDVGILVGPGLFPMDMVGVQTVFGMLPGTRVHLLWRTHDLAKGYLN